MAMKANDVHIETSGIAVTDIDEEIQLDHVIIIHLVLERIGVGVLALDQENLIESILSHQNVTGKVLHADQLVLVQDHQPIPEEIDHLLELMMNTS